MMNKKGFTLSEVMITIGVLGVLAALLVPAVVNNAPDNSKIMFKKAYYNIERITEDLINDNVNYPADEDCGGPPLNNMVCGFSNFADGPAPAGTNKFCFLMADKLNTVAADCTTAMINSDMNDWNFSTTDGIRWKMAIKPALDEFEVTNTVAEQFGTTIILDVNGDRRPNCGTGDFVDACAGADVGRNDQFEIGVRYDGKLQIEPDDAVGIDILQNPTDNAKEQ